MTSLYSSYRKSKYGEGGGLSSLSNMAGTVFSTAGNVADALNPPNKYGTQSMGTNIMKNAGSFAAMGSQFGPAGTAIGAGVGIVKGVLDGFAQKKAQRIAEGREKFGNQLTNLSKYEAAAASDPNAATGRLGAQYFAHGGSMGANDSKSIYSEYIKQRAKGGSLSRLSSETVEVKGPSHAGGGVELPGGNEVEGKETIKGDYVFSERLGFAQLHKPLAKAIGQLEQKAPTSITTNSLRRLRQKEDALMLLQEHVRQNIDNGN